MIQFERDENMKPPTRDEILEGARVTSLPVFERYGVSSVSLLEEVFDRIRGFGDTEGSQASARDRILKEAICAA